MNWSLLRRELDGGRFYHRKTKNRERERKGDTVITVKMNKRGGEGKEDELVDE